MGIQSSIEWTGSTWNPVTGCTKLSAGCHNCYAERMARRLQAMGQSNYPRRPRKHQARRSSGREFAAGFAISDCLKRLEQRILFGARPAECHEVEQEAIISALLQNTCSGQDWS